jgi:putative hydrolase of the HAD superfamily
MIKNVVFDVGNVFVRWSPAEVVERCFKIPRLDTKNNDKAVELFRSPIWLAINRGELTRAEVERAYRIQHGLTAEESQALFFHVMDHQVPVEGTELLAQRLKQSGFRIFGLTDNVREIVAYLKERYCFWDLFEGVVVSAEVGVLKPDQKIFSYLLTKFGLTPSETIFLDDVPANVEGARKAGMAGLVFSTSDACEAELRSIGLAFWPGDESRFPMPQAKP